MRFKTPNVLPAFNAALNRCKGERTEAELAEHLKISLRTLGYWRNGQVPKGIRQLMNCPEVFTALISDLQNNSSDTQQSTHHTQ